MDIIIKIVNPIKFWEVAGAMAGIIAIFPLIWKWMKPSPIVKVFFKDLFIGKSNMISLYYFVPQDKVEEVNYLPFPLVLVNDSDVNLNNFYLHVKSKAKGTDFGFMPRIRFDCEYDKVLFNGVIKKTDDNNILALENILPNYESLIQTITNEGKRIVFPAGTDVPLHLHLSVSKDEIKTQNLLNDGFEVEMFLSFSKKKEKQLKFKVICYFYDKNDKIIIRNRIIENKIKNSKNILVKTIYSGHSLVGKTHINDANPLKVGWYECSREEHSTELLI